MRFGCLRTEKPPEPGHSRVKRFRGQFFFGGAGPKSREAFGQFGSRGRRNLRATNSSELRILRDFCSEGVRRAPRSTSDGPRVRAPGVFSVFSPKSLRHCLKIDRPGATSGKPLCCAEPLTYSQITMDPASMHLNGCFLTGAGEIRQLHLEKIRLNSLHIVLNRGQSGAVLLFGFYRERYGGWTP